MVHPAIYPERERSRYSWRNGPWLTVGCVTSLVPQIPAWHRANTAGHSRKTVGYVAGWVYQTKTKSRKVHPIPSVVLLIEPCEEYRKHKKIQRKKERKKEISVKKQRIILKKELPPEVDIMLILLFSLIVFHPSFSCIPIHSPSSPFRIRDRNSAFQSQGHACTPIVLEPRQRRKAKQKERKKRNG